MYLILNLAKEIKQKQNATLEDTTEVFPQLFWIVRDFVLELKDNNNNTINPN